MAHQVVIVDDDPIVGSLTLELLRDAGLTAVLVQDSLQAVDEIKKERPALVVLDILMPGLDGLTILHRLKSDPETAPIRVVIVSGKSFEAEKDRARKGGADLFIEKPYDVEAFARTITGLLGLETKVSAAPAAAPPAGMKASVWGCRGPSDEPLQASRYGTSTPCVSVETPQHLFIFDAGSGLRALGRELVREGRRKDLWLFLTHFHRDHVEGLAGFACAQDPSYTLRVSALSEPTKPLDEAVEELFAPGPPPAATIELYELLEQTYEIAPGVRLGAFYANHPGATLGFHLQTEGRRIVYCPDSELYGESATALQDYDERLGALCRGADLLFHDGRWTEEDYASNRNGGHSSALSAVDFAGRFGVKRLVLVHQDARYSDADLDRLAEGACARAAQRGYALQVIVGREGLVLDV
ncbi:MAG: response regulator [Elusimicrobia bacterium]|nr:response regulator [Elusimicrobiota bacterium]